MRRPLRTVATALAALLAAGALAACTSDSGSAEDFCAQVKQVPSLETVLSRFSEADPDVLQDRIDKARNAYDGLAAAAPDEIGDETDQVVSLVDAILSAVEENPADPAKAAAQLRTAMADHKGVDADRAAVAAYAQQECDVQLDATLSDGVGATTTSSTTSTTEVDTIITAPSTTTTSAGG
ncbi:MAG: hypothetical protein JWO77_3422 [Ilumatobacteraceae bacterium]|nr:hypothetical protein [Ilumatobacteraceae bacterium]